MPVLSSTVSSSSGVPLIPTGSIYEDFVGFLYGSPWLVNLDSSEERPLTLVFNRVLLLCWSPYYLVSAIFLLTTILHIFQHAKARFFATRRKTCTSGRILENFNNENNKCKMTLKNTVKAPPGSAKSSNLKEDEVEEKDSTHPGSDLSDLGEPATPSSGSTTPTNRGGLEKTHVVSASSATQGTSSRCESEGDTETFERPATWTIYGRTYDLSKFMDSHPGGSWPLVLSKNSDCTILFENYHVFIDREKLGKMMARFEVKEVEEDKKETEVEEKKNNSILLKSVDNPRLSLPPLDPLYADLKQYCRDFFGPQRLDRQKMGYKSWISTLTVGQPHNFGLLPMLLMLLALGLSVYCQYRALVHGDLWAALLFPCFAWLMGVGLGHDTSHFATFSDWRLNRLFGWFATAPTFFNSTAWTIQHVIQHHCFTNSFDDVDIFHFLPLIRNSRLWSRFGNHMSFQLPLLIFLIPTTSLHLSLAVPLDLILGSPVFIGPFDSSVPDSERFQLRYWQCRHLKSLMKDLAAPMLAEVLYVFAFWSFAISQLGLVKALLFFMLVTVISSVLFITFTQPAHLNESAMKNVEENVLRKNAAGGEEFLKPEELAGFATTKLHQDDQLVQRLSPLESTQPPALNEQTTSSETSMMGRWVREQVAYTVDCDTTSWATYFISGGLNMQSIHHVLPIISHTHYRAMYPGYQRILAKHGVYTKVTRNWPTFLLDWFKWVQVLQVQAPEELDWAKKDC